LGRFRGDVQKTNVCEPFFIAQKSAELLGLMSGIRDRVFEHKREQHERTGQEPASAAELG
jgi:hypothetical protein